MNRFLSQKFRFYSFIAIALLLFVHGYNLQVAYLEPFSLVKEPMTITTFTEYFLANGLLRFRLPMLFIFSGYIFAMQDRKPFGERIHRRFNTLILPYFVWGAVGLGITWLWQQFPITAKAVQDAGIDQLGDNRPYSEIGWSGILYRWVFAPVSFQLWFVRSLFIYNLLYPVFKWAIGRMAPLWFGLLFLLWVSFTSFPLIEGQGLFFFSLGIWIYRQNYPLDKVPKWFSYYLAWLFFVGLVVIKTFMAFELEEQTTATRIVFSVLHVISVSAGILAIWFSGDKVVKWAMNQRWFTWAAAFAFIIYALHIPLLPYVTQLFYRYGTGVPNYRLITYLLAPTLVLFTCIAVGALFRKIAPKAYGLTTGGRGF
ncbi:acyltransferase family protein [Pseudocnuella soli]|uniref:acyltransferase family protein n=1 Tax=Pseudocnuella soli TaxID=2502779 RepID=UPI001048714A|nr:acyltransferase family protein [Pseudocnuella soli]